MGLVQNLLEDMQTNVLTMLVKSLDVEALHKVCLFNLFCCRSFKYKLYLEVFDRERST